MKKSQLTSILNSTYNDIVVENFNISLIRTTIREYRLIITDYFKDGLDEFARILQDALNDLIVVVEVHTTEIVLGMKFENI